MNSFGRILPRDFYLRDTLEVARDLLGRYLVHESPEGTTAGKIVETEAYLGPLDKAAHTYKGRTGRNEVVYGIGGHAYVYLIYGMYYCFNIVTGEEERPECVLIRAIEPVCGLELMAIRRRQAKLKNLCNGPGKMCQAMGIDSKRHNGIDLCRPPLYVTAGEPVDRENIMDTPRINIDYAEEAAEYPWRFIIR